MEPSRIVDPAATSILARWELGTHPVSSRPESACFTPPGDEQSGEIGPTGKIVDTLSGTTRAPSATPSARVYERNLGGFGVDDRPSRPGKPRRASWPTGARPIDAGARRWGVTSMGGTSISQIMTFPRSARCAKMPRRSVAGISRRDQSESRPSAPDPARFQQRRCRRIPRARQRAHQHEQDQRARRHGGRPIPQYRTGTLGRTL